MDKIWQNLQQLGKSDRFQVLKRYQRYIIFIIAVAIVVHRRPDVVTNPQFWAEDGTAWYSMAYHTAPFQTLFVPHAGYFYIVPRLAAEFARLFPVEFGPLIFNLVAIAIKLLPMAIVLSSRVDRSLKPIALIASFLYLGIPNSFEYYSNISNAQWHLAIVSCLILLVKPSPFIGWKIFDLVVLLLASLSGPFCLVLLPVAIATYVMTRHRWYLASIATLSFGVALQGWIMLNSHRESLPLGASVESLAKIVGGNIFLGLTLGTRVYLHLAMHFSTLTFFLVWLGAIATLALLVYIAFYAPWRLKFFVGFTFAILGSALISPLAHPTLPQWVALGNPGTGMRYWLLPSVALIGGFLWLARFSPHQIGRKIGIVLLAVMMVGVVGDWHHPAFVDYNFSEYAEQLEAVPPGTVVEIPINPPGWEMMLIKQP